jgi:hypothetical protein
MVQESRCARTKFRLGVPFSTTNLIWDLDFGPLGKKPVTNSLVLQRRMVSSKGYQVFLQNVSFIVSPNTVALTL